MSWTPRYPFPRAHVRETGHVDVSKCDQRFHVGERLRVLLPRVCGMANLHDDVVAQHGGTAVWPVLARGKIR